MNSFSNRELAIIIWFGIALIYLLLSPKMNKVRHSFNNVVATFFMWKLQVIVLLMLTYISVMVYSLFELGLWDVSQLKNTITWSFSVAFMSMFQIEAIKKDRKFFKHAVIDSFKLTALLEFIIGFYSFHLLVEFILFPILSILIVMLTIAESDEKYLPVKLLLSRIIGFFGFTIIIFTLYMLIVDITSFVNIQTIYDYTVLPLLTLLFLPFIFCLMIFMTYENVLIRVQYSIKKRRHRVFAKLISMLIFNVRIDLLERWCSSLPTLTLKSYGDIWNSLIRIFKMRKMELNPKEIHIDDGWSPYIAKDVLTSFGLKTGFYHETYDEWYALSPPVEIGSGAVANNSIAYYVDGIEGVAKVLKLKLNVNVIETADEAHKQLLGMGKALFKYAVSTDFPQGLEVALLEGHDFSEMIGNSKVSVMKTVFSNRSFYGYEVKFVISNENGNC